MTCTEFILLAHSVRERFLFLGDDWDASALGSGGIAVVAAPLDGFASCTRRSHSRDAMNQECHQVLPSVSQCHLHSAPVGERERQDVGMLSYAKRERSGAVRWLRPVMLLVQFHSTRMSNCVNLHNVEGTLCTALLFPVCSGRGNGSKAV